MVPMAALLPPVYRWAMPLMLTLGSTPAGRDSTRGTRCTLAHRFVPGGMIAGLLSLSCGRRRQQRSAAHRWFRAVPLGLRSSLVTGQSEVQRLIRSCTINSKQTLNLGGLPL
ncbi:unnamed protein product [Gadus morhua 'NCC']